MKTLICCIAVGIGLLICPSMTAGQTPDTNLPNRSGIVWSPSATATSGIDTNVFHEEVNPKSDFVTTFTPSLTTSIGWGRLAIRGRGNASFVRFQTYAGERSIDTADEARLDLSLGRMRPFAAASFLNTRQRPELEIDARARRIEESLTAGVNVRLTGKTSIEVSMNRESRQFDAGAVFLGTSLSESLNRVSNTLAGNLYVSVTPLTTIAVGAIASTERYPIASFRDLQTLRIESRVFFNPRAAMSGRATFGYRRSVRLGTSTSIGGSGPVDIPIIGTDPLGASTIAPTDVSVPRLGDFAGPVAAVDVAYRVAAATTVTALIDRDLSQSFRLDLPTYIFTRFGGGILQEITGNWRVRGRLLRQAYDYRAAAGILLNAAGNEPSETVFLGHAGLEYRPRRGAGMEVGVDQYVRHSTVSDQREVRGFQFGVSFTYGLSN